MPGAGIVTLQLGQCGNQLGHELFATLAREISTAGVGAGDLGGSMAGGAAAPAAAVDELLPQFFRRGTMSEGATAGGGGSTDDGAAAAPVARSVLVDMEPKVIWQVVEKATASRGPGRWRYQPGGSYAQAGGAGNNWAYGFTVHGPAASETVLELVRKEAENCDRLGGLMLLQSLAGGTGSGVGTYLTEALRDHYPHATLLNHTVWPYRLRHMPPH
jgi:tubulin delta